MRQLLTANYGGRGVVHLDRLQAGAMAVSGHADPWEAVVEDWRNYYRSLTAEQRSSLRCFTGHQAPFLLESIDDRPVRAFCMLRDPVELVISLYLFMRWRADHLRASGPAVFMLEEMRARGWGLKDIYLRLGDSPERVHDLPRTFSGPLFAPFFNGQSRQILLGRVRPIDMPFTADAVALDDFRLKALEILAHTYVVGAQDRFSESVRLFADAFQWRTVFVPHANRGPLRSRNVDAEVDEETRSLIRAYNQVDAGLHARYSKELSALPATSRVTDVRGRVRRQGSRLRQRLWSPSL